MLFDIGPFTLYRVQHSGTLDIGLKSFPNSPFGWEYGWDDSCCNRKPLLLIRLRKLVIFEFEKFNNGFEIRFFGFWFIN